MPKLFFLCLIFASQFLLSRQLLCGSKNIEHCLECNNEYEICAKCEDKYFPLYGGGLTCVSCNDTMDGQIGCEGKCDASRIIDTRIPLCEENGCKEGYYNVEGICYPCSINSPNCTKCSYLATSENSGKWFTCLECEGGKNGIFRPHIDGKCYECFILHCLQNGYIPGTNDCLCKKCEDGYYLSNSNHTCKPCGNIFESIPGGKCSQYYCPDDGKNYSYTKSCSCNSGYTLINESICISCPSNCKACHYDENSTLICDRCKSKFYLNENECIYINTASSCSCNYNERFDNSNYYRCKSCNSYYTLIASNNSCVTCPNNCPSCHLENNILYCDSCDINYVLNESKLCEICSNNEEIGGIGCLNCEYEYGKNKNKCTKCSDEYIFIENDMICKLPSEINLNLACEIAIRLDNNDYSCIKCRALNYTLVTKYNNIKDYNEPKDELINCIKGYEYINGTKYCTECFYNYPFIWSEKYKQYICNSECESDCFFNKNLDPLGNFKGCTKCDDEEAEGQIGCNSTQGCNYNIEDNHFYCQSCKTGYFKFDWQCLHCSRKDGNCTKCHFNNAENRFKCDECVDKFFINKTSYLCDLITYDEYPEITAGCILPINNHTLYEKSNKCFSCKYGFFKTKDESCIYCKARKNGGPKCDECQYIINEHGIETDKINCRNCPSDNMLSPSGKCYNCLDEVGPGCKRCKFVEETEEVICEECEEDYEMNSEGYCTSKYSYSEEVKNCLDYEYDYDNINIRSLSIHRICKKCNDGYYLAMGKCEILSLEICSIKSILQKSIYNECKAFCEMMYYPFIVYKSNNEEIDNILRSNISYDTLSQEIKNIIENVTLCINNIDKYIELRKCIEVEYDSNEKNYKCSKCINGYQINDANNLCIQINEIEDKSLLKKECNNNTILIQAEKDIFCEEPVGELEGCSNGTKADTQYVNTIYNCYNCSFYYKPFFSNYFKRFLCIGRFAPPTINTNQLSDDAYKGVDKDSSIINGICSIKEAFTPNGIDCYKCNNDKVGMPGCKGPCTYSIKRNNIIECEGECLTGYIETSKGLCEPCEKVNKGCLNCVYNKNYPIGFSGLKRENRFECLECDDGYQLTKDGLCHHCSEFGFTHCDKCTRNNIMKEIECFKCIDGYFLTNNGYCAKCEYPKVQGNDSRCIFCNNIEEGGIDGCERCYSDNGYIICKQCKNGYILVENDNSCLKISEHEEIEKFTNCQKVLKDNNNYKCAKCFDKYNLLFDKNRNNEERCVNSEFLLIPKNETLKYCKQAINMGTEDKPKHSCNKCVENDIITQEERENGITITKITYQENGTSFCDISKNYKSIIDNCSEAMWLIDQNGERQFNCTKCEKDNKFVYKADKDMSICEHFSYPKNCMVKNCKTCKSGNNYFCSQCLFENYKVNPATGSCVKILPKPPVISWKDIYRLIINSQVLLNSQVLYGFSIYLRGISYNEFSLGHAFLIELTFYISLNRNLRNNEETESAEVAESRELKIPAYCQITSQTDEVKDKLNLIDYYCFGNRTGEDEIRENEISLKKIEISNDNDEENKKFLLNSNFEEMISDLNFENIKNKNVSSFTLKMLDDITVFEMDQVVDQKFNDYKFEFAISGKINRELEPDTIRTKFKFADLENKDADCEFIIKENQKAYLKCYVDLENYKDKETFKFKTIEFKYKESSIFLNRFNEISLVNEVNEVNVVNDKKKPDTIKKVVIIVVCIFLILIMISIILSIRALFKKKKNTKKTNNSGRSDDIYDNNINYINSSDRMKPKRPKKLEGGFSEKPEIKIKKSNIKNSNNCAEKTITNSSQKTTQKSEGIPGNEIKVMKKSIK